MFTSIQSLLTLAVSVGIIHTVLGPDHYVPITALALDRRWGVSKTILATLLFGAAHVMSAFFLGLIGLYGAERLSFIRRFETFTGSSLGWLLMGLGLFMAVLGLRKAFRPSSKPSTTRMAPWILFIAFVLGPCEPLIPLLMIPAAHQGWPVLLSVTGIFSGATLATMMVFSVAGLKAAHRLPASFMNRWATAMAGASLLLCGAGVQFLGL